MKQFIISSFLIYCFYLFVRAIVTFSELSIIINTENFLLLGVSFAFCLSVLFYLSSKTYSSLGVNVVWLSIALTIFIKEYDSIASNWILVFYLFFLIFPLLFIFYYLFFESEVKEKLFFKIATIVVFWVIGLINIKLNYWLF